MEIERVSEDGLSREVWVFRLGVRWTDTQVNAVITKYAREKRASKRHKFVSDPAHRFSDFDRRKYNSGIEAQDVPLPDDVIAEVKARVTIAVHPADADRRGMF